MTDEVQFASTRPNGARTFGKRQALRPTRPAVAYPGPLPKVEPIDYGTTGELPLFTVSLIAVLAIIFGAEVALDGEAGKSLSPSFTTLYLMGASSRDAILGHGEWWRLFTAPLLHANLAHIGMNCLALFLIGRQLEPIIGSRWMAAIFALSAVCGSLASVMLHPGNVIGIGASGGIVGIFAAAVVAMLRLPRGKLRSSLAAKAVFGLASSLIPTHGGGASVDYAAHMGGAASGVIASLLMLLLWPRDEPSPEASPLAATVAGAFFAVAAWAVLPASQLYMAQTRLLAPHLPADIASAQSQADQLIKAYPHDPRVIFLEGLVQAKRNDLVDAEASFRAALRGADEMGSIVSDTFRTGVTAALAATLYGEGRKDEARALAAPVCGSLTGTQLAAMEKLSLCPTAP
ncbi:MAG TPA: rhomboid family intramembrane serine protease [Devosia sp.]|nr:rhomboid family intramembrane serine protease [Devosia sp.]